MYCCPRAGRLSKRQVYLYYVGVDDAGLQMQFPSCTPLSSDGRWVLDLDTSSQRTFDEPTNNNQTGMPSAWCTDGKEYVLSTLCWAKISTVRTMNSNSTVFPSTHSHGRAQQRIYYESPTHNFYVVLSTNFACNWTSKEAVMKLDTRSHRVKSQWLEILSTPKSTPPSSVEPLSSGDS
jgi:hypothetical protein